MRTQYHHELVVRHSFQTEISNTIAIPMMTTLKVIAAMIFASIISVNPHLTDDEANDCDDLNYHHDFPQYAANPHL
jgi:hypothetical protein